MDVVTPVDSEEISKRLEKIKDIEISEGRKLKGITAVAISVIASAMSIFHIYVLIFRAIDPWYFRSFHVGFAGVLIFAMYPAWQKASRDRLIWIDYLFMLLLVSPITYMVIEFDKWIYRVGVIPNTLDFIFSLMFVIAVIEMTRRATGWPLTILSILFIIYGYFGKYMPGLFMHRGYSWERIITYLFSLEGILSIPVSASATYVFLFVLFGVFVELSGLGKFFVDFAMSVAGWMRGGPAKVSIISSALFGTASGSSVANVVVDGVFNIPLMKASGFTPAQAGAIEAMNSTGGQITPPVMGAAAFLMAEILGIPYPKIAVIAIIPALLYYTAAYWMIDFQAAKMGIRGIPKKELPGFFWLMKTKGHFLIPLIVLFYTLMVMQVSPFRSAMWAVIATFVVSLVERATRMGPGLILKALSGGGKRSIEIAATCAAAGIIVGILSQTGLGMKFAMIIIGYSGNNLLIALIFTMVIAILLGMGMPTTAAYAIAASVLSPALIQMGVKPLAAHMFIFYFACISALTPPVALAAYAAAAIANAKMWEVGLLSVKFALAGFIIPYMFVYGPAILLYGSWPEVIWAIITAGFGTMVLAAAVQGWLLGSIKNYQRIILLIASLSLIKPGIYTDLIGFILFAIILAIQLSNRKSAVSVKA